MNRRHLLSALGVYSLLAISASAQSAPKQPFDKGVKLDVSISKPAKIKGGDHDDQTQKILVKVKLTNKDLRQSYEGLTGSILVLGQSAEDKEIRKVLLAEKFEIALTPTKSLDHACEEIITQYDKTYAVFGHFYDGWIFLVHDADKKLVMIKSNLASLEKFPEAAEKLTFGTSFDRKLVPVKTSFRR